MKMLISITKKIEFDIIKIAFILLRFMEIENLSGVIWIIKTNNCLFFISNLIQCFKFESVFYSWPLYSHKEFVVIMCITKKVETNEFFMALCNNSNTIKRRERKYLHCIIGI